MSVKVKSFPKSANNIEYLKEIEPFTSNLEENFKCGCVIIYYQNMDGTFIRERDWCKTHESEALI